MFFTNITENNKRKKSELAKFAREVFSNPEMIEKIMESNHTGAFNNFTLHPTMECAPVIIEIEKGTVLGRRMTSKNLAVLSRTSLSKTRPYPCSKKRGGAFAVSILVILRNH